LFASLSCGGGEPVGLNHRDHWGTPEKSISFHHRRTLRNIEKTSSM
jgi:hypothetical protein